MLNKLLLSLFLFLLPAQLGKHFFFNFSYLSGVRVDYLAPTIYLTDLVVLLLLIINLKTVVDSIKQKKFLLFLVFISINFLVSQSQLISIYYYLRIIEWLMVFLIFQKQKPPAKSILLPITISGLIQLVLVIFQFVNKHSIQGIFYFLGERYFSLSTPGIAKAVINGVEMLRPYGTFSHPNSLAGFYLLMYFFVLTSKGFGRLGRFGLVKNSFLFIATLLVFISFSKIAIIIFLILNTCFLILNNQRKCTLCLVAKTLTMTVAAFIFLLAQSDPLSLEKRLSLAKNALSTISQNFLFGVGAGSYLVAQNQLSQLFFNFINQPVHNLILLLMTEWGVITTGLVLYFSWPMIKLIFKKNRWVLWVVILTGLFDHYWLTLNQNFLLLAVVFASL